MKAFLRHRFSGQYFQAVNRWTPDRECAHDFGLVPKAVKAARKLGVRGLDVVLAFEDPGQLRATSFKDLWRGLAPLVHA